MSCEKELIIPTVESNIFSVNSKSRFALGVVAVNDIVIGGRESEFNGIAQLRANTYLDKGFVSADDLDSNGTELDENDFSRSVHFAMLERTAVNSMARVIGNMRLIIKSQDNSTPLPLEGYCSDHFQDNPIPIGGVEVSRLIVRHEDAYVQNTLKWPLFVAGQKYVDSNDLGPVYGLMSPALTRLLRYQRIPVSAAADARYIEEINATKQPVTINMPVLKRLISAVGDQGIDIAKSDFSYIDVPEVVNTKKKVAV